MAKMVKNPPGMQETHVRFLGQEDPLKKEMATNSGSLAWRIPWTEEPGGLQSRDHRESDTPEQLTLSEYIVITNVFLVFMCNSMFI